MASYINYWNPSLPSASQHLLGHWDVDSKHFPAMNYTTKGPTLLWTVQTIRTTKIIWLQGDLLTAVTFSPHSSGVHWVACLDSYILTLTEQVLGDSFKVFCVLWTFRFRHGRLGLAGQFEMNCLNSALIRCKVKFSSTPSYGKVHYVHQSELRARLVKYSSVSLQSFTENLHTYLTVK